MQSRTTILAGLISVMALMLFAVSPANARGKSTELKILMWDVSLNNLPFVMAYEEVIY